jgi:uncharacterized protein (DUF488 family)
MATDKNKGKTEDNPSSTSSSSDKLPNFFKGSTDALDEAGKVILNEMSGYETGGKNYSTLCLESGKFRDLFKRLNSLNESIKGADRLRKKAIKDCPRPASKVKDDAFMKRVKTLTQQEFDELRGNPPY